MRRNGRAIFQILSKLILRLSGHYWDARRYEKKVSSETREREMGRGKKALLCAAAVYSPSRFVFDVFLLVCTGVAVSMAFFAFAPDTIDRSIVSVCYSD